MTSDSAGGLDVLGRASIEVLEDFIGQGASDSLSGGRPPARGHASTDGGLHSMV